MSKIVCITSMNKSYYDHIGKLMIESWSKFWPEDCELVVYQEGFEIENFKNVRGISWEEYCFKQWEKFDNNGVNLRTSRFAKKGFSMIAGMKHIECDLLIWVDADVITKTVFPKDKIESILPKEKLIALFDTYYQKNPNYTEEEYLSKNRVTSAAESGFVVINKNHKNFNKYLSQYEKLYTAETKPEIVGNAWYDGNVCTAAATDFREDIEDLSKLRTTNKSQTPLNRSWLSLFIYHAKAKQKTQLNFNKIRKDLGIK